MEVSSWELLSIKRKGNFFDFFKDFQGDKFNWEQLNCQVILIGTPAHRALPI